jgi:hypothetical protein
MSLLDGDEIASGGWRNCEARLNDTDTTKSPSTGDLTSRDESSSVGFDKS